MAIELVTTEYEGAKIRVIGVGGGGGNAINSMINQGLNGVDFIAANTDKQALDNSKAPIKIQLGKDFTRGLGAGANPDVGKKSVEESIEEIKQALKGTDMLFVTSGMGGGTGTGGAPGIARIGKDLGALVVGIVTKPFQFEGRKRNNIAESGILELRDYVDALIVIPNQKLLDIIDKKISLGDAFSKVNDVLYDATRGISDIISKHGLINVDFADVKTVMQGMGDALMGIGHGKGENRASEAAHNALNSPLLDGISIHGSKGVLVNITGGKDLGMMEIAEALEIIEEAAGEDANLIHGIVYNDEPTDEISITVVATGFNNEKIENPQPFVNINQKQPNVSISPETLFDENSKIPKSTKFPIRVCEDNSPKPSEKFKTTNRYAAIENIKVPKGADQLENYSEPTIIRKSHHILDNSVSDIEKNDILNMIPNNKEKESEMSFIRKQPAFLRKMMD